MKEMIHSGKSKRPRKTVIYGVAGIGKSTLASTSDDPIFVPTEDGLADINCDSFPVAKSYSQFREHMNSLVSGIKSSSYRTVVVDSIDWLEKLVHQQVVQDHNAASSGAQIQSISEIAWGKGVDAASAMISSLLRNLDWFIESGYNVILVGHDHVETVHDPSNGPYDRFTLRMHKKSAPQVIEWADEVLFGRPKIRVRESEAGDRKAISIGDRVLVTDSMEPTVVAKNRLRMPHEIEFSWAAYSKFFKGE